MKAIMKIAAKKKKMSTLFFTLLIANLAVCVLQTGERIWQYLIEPTIVDAYLIETRHGAFPNVYFFPETTQEYRNFDTESKILSERNKIYSKDYCGGFYDMSRDKHKPKYTIEKILKYLRIGSYITDAYFLMGKLRSNLTIKYDVTLIRPFGHVSSPLQLEFGNLNNKMVIKLKFPKHCIQVDGLIDPSPVGHLTYETTVPIRLRTLRIKPIQPIKTVATTTVLNYNFINRKRNPCNENLIACLHPCLRKEIKCRYSFYKTKDLPKCNDTYLRQQFQMLTDFIRTTNLMKHCECLDVCEVRRLNIIYEELPSSEPAVDIFIVSNYVRVLQERFSYDIITLLCDIGGNIGLYFGMSCLMLIEIFIHCCKMFFKKFKKITNANSKLKHKIETILTKNKNRRKNVFIQQKMKNAVFLILILMSVYNVCNQIITYLDFPLVKTVSLVKDDFIHFPLIVSCADSKTILLAKNKMANQLGTVCTNYQLLDLLDPPSPYLNNSRKLWKDSKSTEGYYMQATRGKMKWSKHDKADPKVVNISYLPTVFGMCTVFKKVGEPYFQKKNSLMFTHGFRPTFRTLANKPCNLHLPNFILPQNQIVHPKHIFYRHQGDNIQINLWRQTLIRLNTPKSSCESNEVGIECAEKCYKAKLDQRSFKCKLPFMENSSLPDCKDYTTAKATTKQYLEIQFKTNPQNDCACAARCEETIFLPSVITDTTGTFQIKYSIDSNIREVIEEQQLISVVKLFCQVGSIFGILTGLSIFALIEYFI